MEIEGVTYVAVSNNQQTIRTGGTANTTTISPIYRFNSSSEQLEVHQQRVTNKHRSVHFFQVSSALMDCR
jgi:activator of HSP90 ATPase